MTVWMLLPWHDAESKKYLDLEIFGRVCHRECQSTMKLAGYVVPVFEAQLRHGATMALHSPVLARSWGRPDPGLATVYTCSGGIRRLHT
jgi:hypothetical protein